MHKNIHVLSRAVIIDQDHILLCQTLDLPISFYYLPGGHVDYLESAEETLLRELQEETNVQAEIKRFLGCLEYSFEPGQNSKCHNHEYNFIFEANAPDYKFDKKMHSQESHIGLVWTPLKDLDKIDLRAEPLKKLIPKWLQTAQLAPFESVMI